MKTSLEKFSDEELVTAHIEKHHPEVRDIVRSIRAFVLPINPEIGERIKWNNPTFYYTGPLVSDEPKKYPRDMVVFNLHKNRVMLVFPSGAKVFDPTGLLKGTYADGRRTIVFTSLIDFQSKMETLKAIIIDWLSKVERP